MVHVHGPSRRLRATCGKITQNQFKKKLCKCYKIRLLSLVTACKYDYGVQPINRTRDRTILLKTKNTSVISSNVNRKKYLVVTFKVTLMFNYPSPFIPSRKKTAKYIKTSIENC